VAKNEASTKASRFFGALSFLTSKKKLTETQPEAHDEINSV
jgi:hypothetical protein